MLTIHILSIFPEIFHTYLNTSIPKRAQEKGLFRYFSHNLTDWSVRNTRRVDDRPYGGLPGTILTVEPLTNALGSIQDQYGVMPIFALSPRGIPVDQVFFEQQTLKDDQDEKSICIICGHYEGFDERIFSLFPITQLSIGPYVLSSGELAGLVCIDGIVRLIPGVVSSESLEEETFSKKLNRGPEYPQYSRPQVFQGLSVPEVLVSGNHDAIEAWKQSHIQTNSQDILG